MRFGWYVQLGGLGSGRGDWGTGLGAALGDQSSLKLLKLWASHSDDSEGLLDDNSEDDGVSRILLLFWCIDRKWYVRPLFNLNCFGHPGTVQEILQGAMMQYVRQRVSWLSKWLIKVTCYVQLWKKFHVVASPLLSTYLDQPSLIHNDLESTTKKKSGPAHSEAWHCQTSATHECCLLHGRCSIPKSCLHTGWDTSTGSMCRPEPTPRTCPYSIWPCSSYPGPDSRW